MQIFVADPDPFLHEVFSRFLEDRGQECRTTTEVHSISSSLEKSPYDVLVAEEVMVKPAYLRQIVRKHPKLSVMIWSAKAKYDVELALSYKHAGAKEYVLKLILPEMLWLAIRGMVSKSIPYQWW